MGSVLSLIRNIKLNALICNYAHARARDTRVSVFLVAPGIWWRVEGERWKVEGGRRIADRRCLLVSGEG